MTVLTGSDPCVGLPRTESAAPELAVDDNLDGRYGEIGISAVAAALHLPPCQESGLCAGRAAHDERYFEAAASHIRCGVRRGLSAAPATVAT